MTTSYKAFNVDKKLSESIYSYTVATKNIQDLPAGDLLIRVHYSALNFKDALSAKGNKAVTRYYPHTPGIDAAGIIEKSSDEQFKIGDEVLVTGYDLGMNTPGGFGQYISIPSGWAIHCPKGLTLKDSMALGTAGLTVALSIEKLLLNGLTSDTGDVIVSGSTGGVGSLSVAILAKLGFSVAASTGKLERANYLTSLGANKIIDRDTITEGYQKPLLKENWSAAIDTVGGDILFNIIKSIKYGGSVACCGLVASPNFQATVFPFILRGINLLGVDSVELPIIKKKQLWEKLANDLFPDKLEKIVTEIGLNDLEEYIERIFKGSTIGRVVVKL